VILGTKEDVVALCERLMGGRSGYRWLKSRRAWVQKTSFGERAVVLLLFSENGLYGLSVGASVRFDRIEQYIFENSDWGDSKPGSSYLARIARSAVTYGVTTVAPDGEQAMLKLPEEAGYLEARLLRLIDQAETLLERWSDLTRLEQVLRGDVQCSRALVGLYATSNRSSDAVAVCDAELARMGELWGDTEEAEFFRRCKKSLNVCG
jgi:hypothetical protein